MKRLHRAITDQPSIPVLTGGQHGDGPASRVAPGVPLMLFAGPVFAQAAAPDVPGLSIGVLLQTVLSLMLVVGLIFAAAYLTRKLNGGRVFGGNGPLRIVGGLPLGPRERIVLLEIGDTWLVVGVTAGRMQTLHTLPKGILRDGEAGDKQFAQWLKRIGERNNEDH